MKIQDTNNINGLFIIKISKSICNEKGLDIRNIGGQYMDNKFCQWWQEHKEYHEISLNVHYANNLISKYNLTDDDIEIYLHKKVKIKVEIGKCPCCGKGKRKYILKEVDRICPITKRAHTFFNGEENTWINSSDYIIL